MNDGKAIENFSFLFDVENQKFKLKQDKAGML